MEGIITLLDKLPYSFKSWHLKRRNVHITIKMLKIEYWSEAPSSLRYHKYTRIETGTTWEGFYCSLAEVINLLLNNRMMSCRHLDIKVLKVTEQGRTGSKLKMVALNHIKHKPVGCNASPLIQKSEKHTNLKSCRCRGWGWRGGGPQHIRSTDPHAHLSFLTQ